MDTMSSILDIDLDYFNLIRDPLSRLYALLEWAQCPVAFIIEKHHQGLRLWKDRVKSGRLSIPSFILHVDEHHDMMDENSHPNIGNLMHHAMREWPECRVHWLTETPIDCPAMWLSDETWDLLCRRFSVGPHIPRDWPKPDLVSVCTSPEFVDHTLRRQLLGVLQQWTGP